MPREFSRPQRVADFLKRELAGLIQLELRDPRIGMVNVNDVEVSRDLAHAKVYVTFLGVEDAESAEESIEVLNKAAGYLRTQVAKSTQMRSTPKLRFYFDSSVYRGAGLSALIDHALEEDKKHHQDDEGEAQ